VKRIGLRVLAALSLGVAAYSIAVYGFFPPGRLVHPDMRAVFEAVRLGLYLHVFGSTFALALGPFQFSARLRARHVALHRVLGRLYLGVGVLLGGGAGFYMAFRAFGGIVSKAGFACLAMLWLFTGLRAFVAIRRREIAAHGRWMVRNFALTFAAVTLRIWLPGWVAAGVPFEAAYPVVAWLCWVPNAAVAEIVLRSRVERAGR
jgi:uncharacterized membrane protein